MSANRHSCRTPPTITSSEIGGKVMTHVTFVQRLNTKGGAAPADGCSTAGDVGKQTLVPYTADYYFFRDRGQSHDSRHLRPAAEYERRSGPRRRLLHGRRCRQTDTRAVHRRLLLLPRSGAKS